MTDGIVLLSGTAASLGFIHTLLGPDHYLPFIAMSRAGGWSRSKTIVITLLCGLGHVLSSVLLGTVGIAFGMGVLKLEALEGLRADLAGWLLLTFGLVYFGWGVRRAIRNRPHAHGHVHANGMLHAHEHVHNGEHLHVHADSRANKHGAPAIENGERSSLTPWVLFTIFLFGPCEPLIPVLMYPAANGRIWDVVLVSAVFAVTTLATMIAAVLLARTALARMQSAATGAFARLERYSHALTGFMVLLCGAAMIIGF